MAYTTFDPPGFAQDLTEPHRRLWSDWISEEMDAAIAGNPGANDGPRPQFFNPLRNAPGADAVEADVAWTAFPRQVQITSATDLQRWRRADASRDEQDEYCEWSVERDVNDKITRVSFTSEGPEYWATLTALQPEAVLALYREHVSPRVEGSDLFQNGEYEPRNRWNNSTSRGVMHLIQRSNSLHAEIELAGAATIVRRKDGRILVSAQELIRCSAYGAPERHSDPLIGAKVNELARQGADVTLANPVGLYIADLATHGWETPDGSDPKSYWRITRGRPQKALRAVYEVPVARGFSVGDVKIAGRPIRFGAQIADFITIKLTGLATRIGESTAQPRDGCTGSGLGGAALVAAPPSVSELLARAAGRRGR